MKQNVTGTLDTRKSKNQPCKALKKQVIMNINITSLLLLLGCMQLSATTLSQTINLKAEAQPLTKVFATIEKQTGYFVVYNSLLQQSADLITIEATNMPLDEFLNTILEARS